MDAPASSLSYGVDAGLRRRAKERLYVICQTAGWLSFLVVQLVFVRLLGAGKDAGESLGAIGQTLTLGLLLTHLARGRMTRWGWKELGWRPLVPRILGMAAVLAVIWCALSYGLYYGVLRNPWPEKYHPLALISVSVVNGTLLMAGWLCLYFFYHLFDRYNRLRIEQLRLVAVVKEAELRALKSQVNPHFIFNSLNSLRGLIDENPARARQAVTQLANLLRYSLQSGHLETVPFEEELGTVNDYLALEQVRHEERLRVRLDVAPDALHCPVPPMLLQTLVENAVKYGIAPRREGGEIAVRAWRGRDDLRIEVTNPGTLAPGGGSTGVGLRNAGERLRLLFGDHAALHLREDPPGRVVAAVRVPLAPAGPAREPAPQSRAEPPAAVRA
jgi:two-component system, LytTR family, sensor kinase